MLFKKIHLEKEILAICLFVLTLNLTTSISYKFFDSNLTDKHRTLYGSDAQGYYEYLQWGINKKNINYESANSYPRGNGRILKYTFGTALFQLPFYYTANLFDSTTNYEYTKIDDFFICLGASIYIALALALLYKLLGKFSSNKKVNICCIILIYLGTNLFHYAAIEIMMSHLYSFLSITGFLYYTVQHIQSKKDSDLLRMLIFVFLVIAVRPLNLLFIFPFTIYHYIKLKSLKFSILTGGIILFSFFTQLLLWRLQCGQWTFSSYDGEGFYWTNPQFNNVLFSFRKGLFIYSPIILISLLGLLIKWKSHNDLRIIILLASLIITYVISCWWHWPFGDSFGHRAFIDIYSVAAIGLTVILSLFKSNFLRIFSVITIFLLLCLNLFQTWQFNRFILPAEYMTYDKYKYLFLNTDNPSNNCLGGPKDIMPFNSSHNLIIDSISFVNMESKEYSMPLDYTVPKDYKTCYIDVSFTKEENIPNQSNQTQLYFQIYNTKGENCFSYGTCINETPNDYQTANSKNFSYQITIPSLKNKETVRIVFGNSERKTFILKNILVKRYLFN